MCNCIKTITHGAIGLAKVALRIDIADKELIEKRRDICRWCVFATKNKDPKYDITNGLTNRSFCQKCKCLIVAKTQINNEKCPEKMW